MQEYRHKQSIKAIKWDGKQETLDHINETLGHKRYGFWIRRAFTDAPYVNVLCMPFDCGERECVCLPGAWVVLEPGHHVYFMDDKAFHEKFEKDVLGAYIH